MKNKLMRSTTQDEAEISKAGSREQVVVRQLSNGGED